MWDSAMAEERAPKLFVGIGNVLRGDDGVGVRGAEIMEGLPLPPEVEVYEAGTALPSLARMLEDRELVVVLDAIDARAEPGTVFCIKPEQLERHMEPISLHELDLSHALDEARLLGRAPRKVMIVAVQVADVSPALKLSLPVKGALLRALGVAVHKLELPLDILAYLALKEGRGNQGNGARTSRMS
jgi:hydrogenase maturation protease